MTFRVTPHPSTIAVLVVLEYISTLTSTSTPTHYQDELISTTLSIVYSHSTTLPKDWEEFKQLYVTRDGQDHEQLDNVVQGWYQSVRESLFIQLLFFFFSLSRERTLTDLISILMSQLRRLLRQGSDGLMDWIQNGKSINRKTFKSLHTYEMLLVLCIVTDLECTCPCIDIKHLSSPHEEEDEVCLLLLE